MKKHFSPIDEFIHAAEFTDAIPVSGNAEVWYIAHLDAYMDAAHHLDLLHRAISSDYAKGISSHLSIDEAFEAFKHKLNNQIKEFWQKYIDKVASSSLHSTNLKSLGLPNTVEYDTLRDIPFLLWKQKMSSRQNQWRHLVIRIAEDTSGENFVMMPPFHPYHLDSLPRDTQTLPIRDPNHIAIAALKEVLDSFTGDIRRGMNTISGKNSWIRMRCLVNFYTAVVSDRLSEAHPEDFHGWQVTMPEQIPIQDAAAIIAKHAANSSMIQTLAIRAIISYLHDCMDNAENALLGSSEEMVAHVMSQLEEQAEVIEQRLVQLNSELLSQNDMDMDAFNVGFISRPYPKGTPLLSLSPKHSQSRITHLRPVHDSSP